MCCLAGLEIPSHPQYYCRSTVSLLLIDVGQASNDQARGSGGSGISFKQSDLCPETEKPGVNDMVEEDAGTDSDSSDDSWPWRLLSKRRPIVTHEQSLLSEARIPGIFLRKAERLYKERSDTIASGQIPSTEDNEAFTKALFGLGVKPETSKASAEEQRHQLHRFVTQGTSCPSRDDFQEFISSRIVKDLLSGMGDVNEYFSNVSPGTRRGFG